MKKWRNESVNFSHCSVQIFIHYHNTIGLEEQRLEVFLENRCSEKYFLKSTQENLWLKYFKNTFEGAYFTCRFKACNVTKKWTSSQVFPKVLTTDFMTPSFHNNSQWLLLVLGSRLFVLQLRNPPGLLHHLN